jgi:hypothetical protein
VKRSRISMTLEGVTPVCVNHSPISSSVA